jgi:hypothetical protein
MHHGHHHESTLGLKLTINGSQFNNQLDHGSIMKRTNVLTEIRTGVLHERSTN